MTLQELISDDTTDVVLNTDDFAVSITYRIGTKTVTVSAVPDSSVFDVLNEDGSITQIETRDYLLSPGSLVLNSAIRLPDVVHEIVENGRTYRVVSPGNRRCYSYDDEYRLLMRVHTVLAKDS